MSSTFLFSFVCQSNCELIVLHKQSFTDLDAFYFSFIMALIRALFVSGNQTLIIPFVEISKNQTTNLNFLSIT